MGDAVTVASGLIDPSRRSGATDVTRVLARFGEDALRFAARERIAVVPLSRGERYRDASRALARLGVDVDAWPAPPAGLFVVEERSVYLRSRSPMTIAHEFGHALDCALGGGVYLSGIDPRIRACYDGATAFVTPYAATGIDEYFAEALRAFVEVNDVTSHWPRATKQQLRKADPMLYEYVERVFRRGFIAAAELAPGYL